MWGNQSKRPHRRLGSQVARHRHKSCNRRSSACPVFVGFPLHCLTPFGLYTF
jgi:hypothetical protein